MTLMHMHQGRQTQRTVFLVPWAPPRKPGAVRVSATRATLATASRIALLALQALPRQLVAHRWATAATASTTGEAQSMLNVFSRILGLSSWRRLTTEPSRREVLAN